MGIFAKAPARNCRGLFAWCIENIRGFLFRVTFRVAWERQASLLIIFKSLLQKVKRTPFPPSKLTNPNLLFLQPTLLIKTGIYRAGWGGFRGMPLDALSGSALFTQHTSSKRPSLSTRFVRLSVCAEVRAEACLSRPTTGKSANTSGQPAGDGFGSFDIAPYQSV